MRWILVAFAGVGLAMAASASAEVVARAPDGLLAVNPRGRPLVGYMRGGDLVIAQRIGPNRWRRERVARFAKGSTLAALAAGVAGPVAAIVGPTERNIIIVRRRGRRWLKMSLTGRLGLGFVVGWPGVALDRRGLPIVAYTRWRPRTSDSYLILAKISARGKLHTQRITAAGFPESYSAPPAAPVVLRNGAVHVVETYGIGGVVGTIEWMPTGKTWTGLFLSAGSGGFPIGPMFALLGGRGSVLYTAWSEASVAMGNFPVTIAARGRAATTEDIVSERGITTGLVLTRNGPAAATNEWLSGDEFGFPTADAVWAGRVTGVGGSEFDGRIAGLATVPGSNAEDLLLIKGGMLTWFRTPASLPIRVNLAAADRADGSVALSGRVEGARGGRVTIYREQSERSRTAAARIQLGSSASFAFVDPPRSQPAIYRAVYTDPATGIPYAKLLRRPTALPAEEDASG